MSKHIRRIDRPKTEQDFEDWCLRIFSRQLDCPGLKKYGRRGQAQGGIDLIGHDKQGNRVAVQCKAREDTLSIGDIRSDVETARGKHPQLIELAIATTAKRDAKLQNDVLDLESESIQLESFRISLWSWDDIEEYLSQEPDLLAALNGEDPQASLADIERVVVKAVTTGLRTEPRESIDTQIDEAFARITSGKPEECITLLNQLRDTQWDTISSPQRYRILGNLANAYLAKANTQQAGRLYIDAKQFHDTVDAQVLEARGYYLLEQEDKARSLIQSVLSSTPDHNGARALDINLSLLTYQEQLDTVPETQRTDPEVAFALAGMAYDHNLFAEATEHARIALNADPGWDVARTNLAVLLMREVRDGAAPLPDGSLEVSDPVSLNESIDLLTAVIEDPKLADGYRKAVALYNRSSAFKLIGEHDKGRDDLDRAIRMAPDEPSFVATYAATLDFQGDSKEALRHWRKAHSLAPSDTRLGVMLVEALLSTDDSGSTAEAGEVLRGMLPHIRHAPQETRYLFGAFWLSLSTDEGGGDKDPSATLRDILPAELLQALLAERALIDSGTAAAQELLSNCSFESVTFTSLTERMGVAHVLGQLGRAREGIEVLGPAVRLHEHSSPTLMLLSLAVQAHDNPLALSICSTLRTSGTIDPGVCRQEAALLADYEDFAHAIYVLETWASEYPVDPEPWLHIGTVSLAANDVERATAAFEELPEPQELAPRLLVPWLQLATATQLKDAFEVVTKLYEAWREHRTSKDAWKALALASFGSSGSIAPPSPTVATKNCAVKVLIEHTKHAWIVIEPGINPDTQWQEFSLEHKLSKSVLGKKVGDKVDWTRGMVKETAEVIAIVSAAQYGAQRCIDLWEERYPEDPLFHKIQLREPTESTTPEQLKEALRPFADAETQRDAYHDAILNAYTSRSISTGVAGQFFIGGQLQFIETVLSDPDRPFFCTVSVAEFAKHHKSLDANESFVCDASSVIVLAQLGIIETVCSNLSLVVPKRLMLQLAQRVQFLQSKDAAEHHLGFVNGSPIVEATNHELLSSVIKLWQDAIESLEEHAQIESGVALTQQGIDKESFLVDRLGDVDSRVIAIAADGKHALLADDIHVSRVGAQALSVDIDRTSSYAVLLHLHRQNLIEDVDALLAKLVAFRLVTLPVNASMIVAALKLSGWKLDAIPARLALETVTAGTAGPTVISGTIAVVSSQFWRQCAQPERVLTDWLSQLNSRADRQIVGDILLQELDQAFGLDVVGAKDAKVTVRQWLDGIGGLPLVVP